MRDSNGEWSEGTSPKLTLQPESPNTRWCCAGCENPPWPNSNSEPASQTWVCHMCTLENELAFNRCEVCGTPRNRVCDSGTGDDGEGNSYSSCNDESQLDQLGSAVFASSRADEGVSNQLGSAIFETLHYPSHWTKNADSSSYVLIQLQRNSKEFKTVSTHFEISCKASKYRITSIERVQNIKLHAEYQLYRSQLLKELGQDRMNERKLFHGTSANAVAGICEDGFDWRVCGKNGTLYGEGAYFAVNSNYSTNYSSRNSSGERKMFLATVLTGIHVQGSNELKKPPKGFHSAVDNKSSPSIFVVFSSKQAYPEYLIGFTNSQSI